MNEDTIKEFQTYYMRLNAYSPEVVAMLILIDRFDKLSRRLDDIGKILQNRL